MSFKNFTIPIYDDNQKIVDKKTIVINRNFVAFYGPCPIAEGVQGCQITLQDFSKPIVVMETYDQVKEIFSGNNKFVSEDFYIQRCQD